MPANPDSAAVAVARVHVEAWSNHDFDAARRHLSEQVHVTAVTTLPTMAAVDATGIDDYLTGLNEFTRAVVPGGARIIASAGDERNALLTLTVDVHFGAGPTVLAASRLYLLDDEGRIQDERIIFFATPAWPTSRTGRPAGRMPAERPVPRRLPAAPAPTTVNVRTGTATTGGPMDPR
jgi:hypothetical protein